MAEQLDLFPALAWTRETPTQPGHYLYWLDGRDPDYLICTTQFGANMRNFQGRTPADYEGQLWWLGPVPTPEAGK